MYDVGQIKDVRFLSDCTSARGRVGPLWQIFMKCEEVAVTCVGVCPGSFWGNGEGGGAGRPRVGSILFRFRFAIGRTEHSSKYVVAKTWHSERRGYRAAHA